MRRLTATQVAAMTAATVGVWGLASDKLKIPILAMAPIIQDAQAVGFELDEVIVTSTAIKFDVRVERVFANGATQPVGRQVGGAAAGSSLAAQSKQSQECALMYSKGALGAETGANPAYQMIINSTEYGWGTENPNLTSPVTTPTLTPPTPASAYFLINGQTKGGTTKKTWVFEKSIAVSAVDRGLTFKQAMLHALVHEWYHQWFGGGEGIANTNADIALNRYNADGQNQALCQTQSG